jgi:hypothetical protein
MGDALNALSIVDQIHKFAVTTHRDFVIKHLEPWLQLAEEELDSFYNNDDGWTYDDVVSTSFRLNILKSGYHTSSSVPLWKELEEAARLELSNKRNKTREFNRNGKRRTSKGNAVILDEDASMEVD